MAVLLRINLTKKEIKKEKIDDKILKDYLGGKWLSVKIFIDELEKIPYPLSPKNKIVLTNGLFSGTLWPANSSTFITTISPFDKKIRTGIVLSQFSFDFSNSPYSAIVIEGKSKKTCFLYIDDEKVEIREDKNLSQKDFFELKKFLKENYNFKNFSFISIGKAGENLLKSAKLISEYKEEETEGIGAVFGSKNLKSIVIKSKEKLSKIYNKKFNKISMKVFDKIRKNELREKVFNFGTPYFIDRVKTNFVFIDEISYNALKKFKVKDFACTNCPVGCLKYYRITTGRFEGSFSYNFGFEEILSLGVDLKIRVLPSLIHISSLNEKYGFSNAYFSFLARNIIEMLKEEKKKRINLKYGDFERLISVLKEAIEKKGAGKYFGETKEFIEKKFNKKIKEELPSYEELLYEKILEIKKIKIKDIKLLSLIFDLIGMCKIAGFIYFEKDSLNEISKAISILSEKKISESLLKKRAKEIISIEKSYNRGLKRTI